MPVLHRGREPPKPTFHDSTPKLSDQREGWQLYRASNGLPFYFNPITGESVWARELASATVEGSIVGRRDGIDNNEESAQDPQRMGSSGVCHTQSAGTPSSREGSIPSPSSSPRSSSSSGNSGSKSSSTRGSCSSSSSSSVSKSSSIRGSSTGKSSQEAETSSGDTWTGSMERKFRHFVRSVEGRKMLADEVRALTARGATRGRPWRHQPPDTKRQRVRGKPAQGLERGGALDDCDADDVEVALLKETGGGVAVNSYEVTETSEESGSSGASELSLLSDDAFLRRLEGIERALIVARDAVQSMLHALCGVVIHVSGGLMQSLRRWGTRPRSGTDGTFHSASQ